MFSPHDTTMCVSGPLNIQCKQFPCHADVQPPCIICKPTFGCMMSYNTLSIPPFWCFVYITHFFVCKYHGPKLEQRRVSWCRSKIILAPCTMSSQVTCTQPVLCCFVLWWGIERLYSYTHQNSFSNTSACWLMGNKHLLNCSQHRKYCMFSLKIWHSE